LIRPATHYSAPDEKLEKAIEEIEELLDERIHHFKDIGDDVAAQRIEERTKFDLEMIKEVGYCSGISKTTLFIFRIVKAEIRLIFYLITFRMIFFW